ncbi:hypothetical protein TSH100_04080 [Azospirillum sp. TSH100]|uniref:DUF3164 family protein n=1 Tax=Azospirillum sp. TSH100 TaxID=652764 RepID=UPI000D61156D|nr:DUF3164 family protein [Azospirillum sp. TSH100]PWC89824.1 hypothetical protein TSH100_04080 [Azospirillum sp. TSH100]QCG92302.1 DUF3164 family protein [Azospirillum sp. TSH100]
MATDADVTAAQPATVDRANYYEDSRGRLIPAHMVKPTEMLEDQLVKNLMERAQSLALMLTAFKVGVFEDVGAFLAILADEYGAKRGGNKGNLCFTSFDGKARIQVAISERMTFGPELQVAKTLIDECIADWANGADEKLRVLVDHAFQVDKEGQVSRERIFALRRLVIDDPRWCKAMEAISASISIDGTRTYVRFYKRATPKSPWKMVSLNLATADADGDGDAVEKAGL